MVSDFTDVYTTHHVGAPQERNGKFVSGTLKTWKAHPWFTSMHLLYMYIFCIKYKLYVHWLPVFKILHVSLFPFCQEIMKCRH